MTIAELKIKLKDGSFNSITEIRKLHLRLVYQPVITKLTAMQLQKLVDRFNILDGEQAFVDAYCDTLFKLIEVEQTETGTEVRELYQIKPLNDNYEILGI